MNKKFLKNHKNFSSMNHLDSIKNMENIIHNMLQIYPKRYNFSDNINGYLDGFFISILKKEKNN